MGYFKELVYRQFYAKTDAEELEPKLGNQVQIERFIASKEIKKSSYEYIYNELYKLLPEHERAILASVKDELTLMGNYKVLWKKFAHRYKEKRMQEEVLEAYYLYRKFWSDAKTYEFEEGEIEKFLLNRFKKNKEKFTVLTKTQFVQYAFGFKWCTKGPFETSILANNEITAELFEQGYKAYKEDADKNPSTEIENIKNDDVTSEGDSDDGNPVKTTELLLIQSTSVSQEVNDEEEFFDNSITPNTLEKPKAELVVEEEENQTLKENPKIDPKQGEEVVNDLNEAKVNLKEEEIKQNPALQKNLTTDSDSVKRPDNVVSVQSESQKELNYFASLGSGDTGSKENQGESLSI